MRVIGWIVGGLFVLVMIGSALPDLPEDKARQERRDRFCALSPVDRDAAVALDWLKWRKTPGSPWRTYAEFSGYFRTEMGC